MRYFQKEKGKATTISIIMAIAIIVASTTTAMSTITSPVPGYSFLEYYLPSSLSRKGAGTVIFKR
jgi:uncharacterized membrane protein